MAARTEVTRILAASGENDPQCAAKLLPLVYDELRVLARQRLANEPPGLTLQATALVHEAYLRLMRDSDNGWKSRGHFFAAAAEAMRRILVERARKYRGQKHGGGHHRIPLSKIDVAAMEPSDEILALDEALAKLEVEDKTRSDIVKLRYYAGLTIEQAAELLGISRTTVARHWVFAKAWLYAEIDRGLDFRYTAGPAPTDSRT
ncbi:MAG: ECF-type sigma factor [Phycisphaerales bacterium]|nr:ECF-type sigma factor [Phycisphaerales bacterium]